MFENEQDAQRLTIHLRVMRIIIGAMLMGVVSFLAIALFLASQRPLDPNRENLITLMALGGLAFAIIARFVAPRLVAANLIRQIAAGTWLPQRRAGMEAEEVAAELYASDAAKLLAVNQTRTLIAAALLEGASFLGCLAYMVEGSIFALAVPLVGIVLLALTIPMSDRVIAWAETQQARISEMRTSKSINPE